MSGALEAAKEIDWIGTGVKRDSGRAKAMAEIIDRLAVQPAVAAELRRIRNDPGTTLFGKPLAEISRALLWSEQTKAEDAYKQGVAAERKRAEGLVKALAKIAEDVKVFDGACEFDHKDEFGAIGNLSRKALADYESNAPVPTEETGVRELQIEIEKRDAIFRWLLGEEGEFPSPPPDGKYKKRYWWRTDLQKRLAALSKYKGV